MRRKRGRPKIRRKDAIQRDLENFWTESERGDGQGDEGGNNGGMMKKKTICKDLA